LAHCRRDGEANNSAHWDDLPWIAFHIFDELLKLILRQASIAFILFSNQAEPRQRDTGEPHILSKPQFRGQLRRKELFLANTVHVFGGEAKEFAMANRNPHQNQQNQQSQQGGKQSRTVDQFIPSGQAEESAQGGGKRPAQQQRDTDGEQNRSVDHYNPGGQAGKSVEGGGKRPAQKRQDRDKDGEQNRSVDHYNPGGQAGKSAECGELRPAQQQRKPGHGKLV
jgi:hypothetical protein